MVARCNGGTDTSFSFDSRCNNGHGWGFLVVRCSPIFEYSEFALNIVTIVGMVTAIFAASVALVQNDIKKL